MNEKGSSWILKLLAVVSAVALGAGYVAWKNGEARKQKSEAAEVAEPVEPYDSEEVTLIIGSKSPGREVIVVPDGVFEVDTEEVQLPLMPGSKSGILIDPVEKNDDEVIRVLPGSKSLTPIFRERKGEAEP